MFAMLLTAFAGSGAAPSASATQQVATSAPAAAAPDCATLGSYLYAVQAASPVTNRSLADLPASTCDYVDLAGLCLLSVTAAGRL